MALKLGRFSKEKLLGWSNIRRRSFRIPPGYQWFKHDLTLFMENLLVKFQREPRNTRVAFRSSLNPRPNRRGFFYAE
jgi:hypothetical protein